MSPIRLFRRSVMASASFLVSVVMVSAVVMIFVSFLIAGAAALAATGDALTADFLGVVLGFAGLAAGLAIFGSAALATGLGASALAAGTGFAATDAGVTAGAAAGATFGATTGSAALAVSALGAAGTASA